MCTLLGLTSSTGWKGLFSFQQGGTPSFNSVSPSDSVAHLKSSNHYFVKHIYVNVEYLLPLLIVWQTVMIFAFIMTGLLM